MFSGYRANVATKNMTFSSSQLENNHQGGHFYLGEKMKRHKMVTPKGELFNETFGKVIKKF